MKQCEVLIAGAGPTGLVLALWRTKMGVAVRIIDKTDAPGTTSRALAVQARTLELYRQLDLTDAVLQQGRRVAGLNLWVGGEREARVALAAIADGLTPYGPCIFPQDLHERLLLGRLAAYGIEVERQTELLRFAATPAAVTATLRAAGGQEEVCEAAFLAGCDGARSIVRQGIAAEFPGGTYQQLFYVADIDATGPALDGELHIDLEEADFRAVFPLKAEGRARLVGTVRGERAAHADTLTFADVSARAITNMKVAVNRIHWFSTYHVHHRVTDRFRSDRVFLLGDAAHLHSPAGGQGMNTGIGDAPPCSARNTTSVVRTSNCAGDTPSAPVRTCSIAVEEGGAAATRLARSRCSSAAGGRVDGMDLMTQGTQRGNDLRGTGDRHVPFLAGPAELHGNSHPSLTPLRRCHGIIPAGRVGEPEAVSHILADVRE
jgi:2-polyprenyl-6-methoxyphenol hydroxylase-like FAD-dependent oxidoreductase